MLYSIRFLIFKYKKNYLVFLKCRTTSGYRNDNKRENAEHINYTFIYKYHRRRTIPFCINTERLTSK